MTRRWLLVAGVLMAAACWPVASGRHARTSPSRHAAVGAPPGAVERGAVLYAAYCGGCHGPEGRGDGPVAAVLGLAAVDVTAPALRAASDAALVERLTRGTPLRVPAGSAEPSEDFDADALARYLPTLASADFGRLRAGRVVYEGACAACHGAYGASEGAVARWLGVPDLRAARERQSDAALARISESGSGLMPPLYNAFDATELHVLIAYVRHLSEGFRVYDTYCAACHGEDGRGVGPGRWPSDGAAAPPLRGPYARAAITHMLRRERGVMPHFRTLGDRYARDVVAYLRSVMVARRD